MIYQYAVYKNNDHNGKYSTCTKIEIFNGTGCSSEINPTHPCHLIYDKEQEYTMEKTVSLISGAGKTGQLHTKE